MALGKAEAECGREDLNLRLLISIPRGVTTPIPVKVPGLGALAVREEGSFISAMFVATGAMGAEVWRNKRLPPLDELADWAGRIASRHQLSVRLQSDFVDLWVEAAKQWAAEIEIKSSDPRLNGTRLMLERLAKLQREELEQAHFDVWANALSGELWWRVHEGKKPTNKYTAEPILVGRLKRAWFCVLRHYGRELRNEDLAREAFPDEWDEKDIYTLYNQLRKRLPAFMGDPFVAVRKSHAYRVRDSFTYVLIESALG